MRRAWDDCLRKCSTLLISKYSVPFEQTGSDSASADSEMPDAESGHFYRHQDTPCFIFLYTEHSRAGKGWQPALETAPGVH